MNRGHHQTMGHAGVGCSHKSSSSISSARTVLILALLGGSDLVRSLAVARLRSNSLAARVAGGAAGVGGTTGRGAGGRRSCSALPSGTGYRVS